MKRKNHKWVFVKDTLNQRIDQCSVCGIYRSWIGAEYQGWEYHKYGEISATFKRPDCK